MMRHNTEERTVELQNAINNTAEVICNQYGACWNIVTEQNKEIRYLKKLCNRQHLTIQRLEGEVIPERGSHLSIISSPDIHNEIQKLSAEAKALRKSHKSYGTTIQRMNVIMCDLKEFCNEQQHIIQKLQAENAKLKAQKHQSGEQTTRTDQQIGRFSDEIEENTTILAQVGRTNHKDEAVNAGAEDGQLNEVLGDKITDNDNFKTQMDSLMKETFAEIKQLRSALDAKDMEIGNLTEIIGELQDSMMSENAEIMKKREELEPNNIANEKLQQKETMAQRETREMKQKLSVEMAQSENLRSQLDLHELEKFIYILQKKHDAEVDALTKEKDLAIQQRDEAVLRNQPSVSRFNDENETFTLHPEQSTRIESEMEEVERKYPQVDLVKHKHEVVTRSRKRHTRVRDGIEEVSRVRSQITRFNDKNEAVTWNRQQNVCIRNGNEEITIIGRNQHKNDKINRTRQQSVRVSDPNEEVPGDRPHITREIEIAAWDDLLEVTQKDLMQQLAATEEKYLEIKEKYEAEQKLYQQQSKQIISDHEERKAQNDAQREVMAAFNQFTEQLRMDNDDVNNSVIQKIAQIDRQIQRLQQTVHVNERKEITEIDSILLTSDSEAVVDATNTELSGDVPNELDVIKRERDELQEFIDILHEKHDTEVDVLTKEKDLALQQRDEISELMDNQSSRFSDEHESIMLITIQEIDQMREMEEILRRQVVEMNQEVDNLRRELTIRENEAMVKTDVEDIGLDMGSEDKNKMNPISAESNELSYQSDDQQDAESPQLFEVRDSDVICTNVSSERTTDSGKNVADSSNDSRTNTTKFK